MALLTVRNLPDEIHRALRSRAAKHGHSMEAEVRAILESAVSGERRVQLGSLLAEIGEQAQLKRSEKEAPPFDDHHQRGAVSIRSFDQKFRRKPIM
jgi:plasmid stability protein